MRAGEGGKRKRRRAWKATGALLLGLMGGSVGCQCPLSAIRYPPSADSQGQGQTADNGQQAADSGQRIADSGQQTADSGVVQASYQADPDRSRTEENKSEDRRGRARTSEKDKGYQVDRSLPSPANGMATPAIPAPRKFTPITLGESLALAGVANPVIALAQQAVRLSQAELFQARLLLIPDVNVGASYHLHNGTLQSSFGAIRKVDLQSVNYGLGVGAVVAGTQTVPGLFISTPLTDALFNPLIARQVVDNRGFTATATRNDVLLEVSTAYLALLGAEGRLAVIRQSEADFSEVVRLTTNYAKTGLGREADADRARADTLALAYEEQQAQEEVAVAAADLARLLNLDPSARLQTGDVPIQIVTFVDPKISLPKLLEIAARNRPELLAAAAAIRASQIRVQQEKTRPFLPTLWAGFSAADFGGGAVASTSGNVPNPHTGNVIGAPSPETGGQTVPKFGRITGRTDVDVIAYWTLQNFGLGNIAHVRERRAELGQAEAERVRVLNQVGLEVSEAYNTSAQQYLAIGIERRRAQEASDGFQLDLNLIRQKARARPIEVLDQAKRLLSARKKLLEAVIGFDRAQFQLFVALGQPPTLAVDETSAECKMQNPK